ncbi:MAG: ABC transporter permease, partial [Lachnospiraceae bacterium]|nr:ABC transporter permease [Lachnospiraceae bacterium]
FEIMQKVGMTEREIKKSVNSQVLTVFFLPLITAGIHTAFAFPLIQKIMLLFNAVNISLLIWTTIACFLIFGFFYIIVYRMTSRAYLKLVS